MVFGGQTSKDHFMFCIPIRYSIQMTIIFVFVTCALMFFGTLHASVRTLGGGFDTESKTAAQGLSLISILFAAMGSFAVHEHNIMWMTIFYYFFLVFVPCCALLFSLDLKALVDCEFVLTSLHNNEPVDKTYEPLEQVLDRGSSGSCFHIRDAYMFFFFFKMALSLYCGILFRRAINLYSDSPTYHVKFHDLLQDDKLTSMYANHRERTPLWDDDRADGDDYA